MPKIIFLDWNGTLSVSKFWERLANSKHRYHGYFQPIEEFLFKKNDYLIKDWMLGRFDSEEICRIIGEGTGLDPKIIFEELEKSARQMKFVNPQIPAIIREIRKKTKVVVATDNMDTFERFTIPGMGLEKIFDGFLISCEIGCFKYDLSESGIPFFDNYLKANGLSYKEAVLVDDSEERTGTFEKLGFLIRKVDSPNQLFNILREYVS